MHGWIPRPIDPDLARRWLADSYWTDDTLGELLDRGLQASASEACTVRSAVRPYDGTLGDVRDAALSLAAGLRDRGVSADDVVAFQLPNWVEAAHVFYAVALLGATVMPIVHFYGPREVGYILTRTPPA